MQVHKPIKRQGRRDRRFRPGPAGGGVAAGSGLELETRVLLSASATARAEAHHVRAAVTHVTRTPQAAIGRLTPTQEIQQQYSDFANDFAAIEQLYITALNEESSNTVTVSATVTAAYLSGSSSIQVSNAAAFFPVGSTTTVIATATPTSSSSPVIGSFSLIGYTGNTLFVNPAASSPVNLNVGYYLTATITPSSEASAAAIFPSFIQNRTSQMAIQLVQYFNNLPLRLPYLNAPPHTPNNRGAIQTYVYEAIAGGAGGSSSSSSSSSSSGSSASGVSALNGVGATSLQQLLLAIPLPTSGGSPLQMYDATVASAILQSETQTLNGVAQVYAGKIKVNAAIPNNRYGVDETGTVPSYILAQP